MLDLIRSSFECFNSTSLFNVNYIVLLLQVSSLLKCTVIEVQHSPCTARKLLMIKTNSVYAGTKYLEDFQKRKLYLLL